MKPVQKFLLIVTIGFLLTGKSNAQFQTEELGRGLVAVATEDGVYLGWRLLDSDADSVSFNIVRGQEKINTEPITATTNFLDSTGTVSDQYFVVSLLDGVEQDLSKIVYPWQQNYLTIPLQRPAGGTTPDNVNYDYNANDCSVADLDGDGEYEIVLKWDPSNSKDNAHEGHTGNIIMDGLEMDGTLLWRLDLGVNIRAGAHYSPFMVYDLDGDGIAEVTCRTAPGSKDGTDAFISDGPAASADHNADYRNSSGYILTGPEYLTVFNGSDGSEIATTNLEPDRGSVGDWGDTYGNRVDRFLAAVVHLGGDNPSVVWARGIYTKVEIAAWDLVDGELEMRWIFKSQEGYPDWSGMGSHNLSVADVDGDNKDEIIYGNCAIDDDGTGLWTLRTEISTPYPWTGDAMHVADIIPERPGLEKWGCGEGDYNPFSHLVDAATGEVLWLTANGDGERATAGDLVEGFFGMECWGGTDGLRSADNQYVGPVPSSTNHVVWWDGDLGRELLNATDIRKYGGGYLLIADGCSSNNGTKANPCLQADILGDWREEVIWRTSDNNNLRVYTTTDLTEYRIKTLMHDPVYRLGVAWQNVSYNQPPHTSFFLGFGMFTPDSLRPPAKPLNIRATAWDDTVQIAWDENSDLDLAGYRLYRGKSPDSLSLLSDVGTANSYLDTDVTNDSTYYYAVVAYDTDNNESVYSDIVQATPTIRPATPTGISYRFDTNSIMLIWDNQDFENISTINIYRAETEEMTFELINTLNKSLNTYIDEQLTTGKTYYYKISVTDTNDIESFPTGVQTITPGSSFTFQSEDASLIGTVYVENNHLGFHGTAFTNFESNNSAVEFTNMPGFGGGDRTLIFRYALGNTDRTGNLIVNGDSKSLTMRGTGEWTNYVIDSVAVNLNDGYDNTIRFEATGNDYGNLDEITIVPRAITDVEIVDNRKSIPTEFQLYQNYPNPFNPQTTISFALPKAAAVSITLYDVKGRLVRELVNERYQAGIHKITLDGTNLASGVYFVHSRVWLPGKQAFFTKKMILLK
jgi:rhamnogalacturonan endolyase